jgi:hypothetical protein
MINRTGMDLLARSLWLVIISLCLLSKFIPQIVSASASFSLRQIPDAGGDAKNLTRSQSSNSTITPRPCPGRAGADMREIDYFSNGKTLNVTIWLSGYTSLLSKYRPTNATYEYGMLIDSDSDSKTGHGRDGIEYRIQLIKQNKKWTENFVQYGNIEGLNITKSTKILNNSSFFGGPKDHYVKLYANLGDLGYPDNYRVTLYAQVMKGPKLCADFSDWIYIPQPNLRVSPVLGSIDMRQGETRPVDINLRYMKGLTPTVVLTFNQTQAQRLDFSFPTNPIHMNPFGIDSTKMIITVPHDAPVGSHMIPIYAYTAFSSNPFAEFSSTDLLPLGHPTNTVSESDVTVNVSLPKSGPEVWKDIWDTYGGAIGFFLGGITAGASGLLFDRYKKRA